MADHDRDKAESIGPPAEDDLTGKAADLDDDTVLEDEETEETDDAEPEQA